MIRKQAFGQWSRLARLGRAMTRVAALFRGFRARKISKARVFLLRQRQAGTA